MYMPGYKSAANGPIITYKHGEETLYLHSWNSRVVHYAPPYQDMSHVEHWVGGEQEGRRRLWDENLIHALDKHNFMSYLLDEPNDPAVRDDYVRIRHQIADSLGFSDLVDVDSLDDEWAALQSKDVPPTDET